MCLIIIKFRHSLFIEILLILLILQILFILECSPNELEEEFTKVDFYESFSFPKECIKLYHNNPNGPPFLLIDVKYELHPIVTANILKSIIRKYELKLVNDNCLNSLVIKNIGDEFSSMEIAISLSLYYEEEDIAKFIYLFNKDFNSITYKILDINNNFGLEINFLNLADDRHLTYSISSKVKSYLRSIKTYNGSICVISTNNQPLVFWPEYLSKKRGLITRITLEYIKNNTVIFKKYYPAFECDPNKTYHIENIFIIYDGYNLNIHINLIYWKLGVTCFDVYSFQTSFFNSHLWSIEYMHNLPEDAKKLFCLKTIEVFYQRPNNDSCTMYMSESNYNYHTITSKWVNVFNRVKRKKCY